MGTAGVHRAATGLRRARPPTTSGPGPTIRPRPVAWLVERLSPGSGRRVVDLAAGTGKLTRGLVDAGATVIAVEPVRRHGRALRRSVPGVAVVAAVAEALPLGRDR